MNGLSAAASGLLTAEQVLGTVAQNLANVNTVGYKSQRALFEQCKRQIIPTLPVLSAGSHNLFDISKGVVRDDKSRVGRFAAVMGTADGGLPGQWFERGAMERGTRSEPSGYSPSERRPLRCLRTLISRCCVGANLNGMVHRVDGDGHDLGPPTLISLPLKLLLFVMDAGHPIAGAVVSLRPDPIPPKEAFRRLCSTRAFGDCERSGL